MIYQQLLDQINQSLPSNEHIISPFPLDGTFQHFKNGKKELASSHIWAIGYSWEYNGNVYQWVKVGDWRNGSHQTFKSYDSKTENKRALNYAKKYIEKVEETVEEEKNKKHKDCKDKWEPIFNELFTNSDTHEYLSGKKISKNYRARIRSNTTLLIPIEHPDYGFVGVQQIFKKDNKFLKIFAKGIRITGSFTRVTNFDIKKEQYIYIAEGYATACSVYEATRAPVVTCFNCNNIIPVIASIRSINPSVKIIIAADNDHENPKNPGKYKASLAAKQFANTIYKLPEFQYPDNLSDFNDLHITEGLQVVSNQLSYSGSDFISIKDEAILPNSVSKPVDTTIPIPEPLTTVVPL